MRKWQETVKSKISYESLLMLICLVGKKSKLHMQSTHLLKKQNLALNQHFVLYGRNTVTDNLRIFLILACGSNNKVFF